VRRDALDAARSFAPEHVLPELLDAVRWAAASANDGIARRGIETDHGADPGRRIT
jgi:hypothetical protein